MIININESAYKRLFEVNDRKPPFQDFYEAIIEFIKSVFKDPINAKPNDILKSVGLDNGKLRKELYDLSILTKEERIDEPYDETSGKQESRYYVKYSWADDIKSSLKNSTRMDNPLKEKIRKLYNQVFGITETYNDRNMGKKIITN